jgi:hypothetical protein
MTIYYFILLPIMLILLFLMLRSYFLRKKNLPGALFAEALRNENSGEYEQAIITYTNALQEVKKARFRDSHLKNMILEKLKVLNTAIEYQKNFHYDNNRLVTGKQE